MARAKRRKCAFCKTPLPADAHRARKYCDDYCRRGKPRPVEPVEEQLLGDVQAATEEAIDAADHLTKKDAGAIAALRYLARKIDTESALREMALQYADEHETKPPPVDNVSVPTYLKYCESLGLTPAGRAKLVEKAGEASGGSQGSGTLSGIRGAVPRPA